ncbi:MULTISPECIES: HAD family hydrolase [Arthrobacter]|uniref:HAD family hydrolase n=2 Tax=Arthrobacter TaxID=1663 RepID=A0ABU9KIT4_9MICC|nr:HAD family hydrolase [Arthrobacter sp. YJM1]MDP5226951.1 HAD family hydrolase [Arthrobacter sp. YJM1]
MMHRTPAMRLVASDVDGTIMGHDGVISTRTRAAFAAVRDAGVEVVFVTGRPPRWLGPLADQIGHNGTVICSNGAVIWDMAEDRLVGVHALIREQVLRLQEIIREVHPEAGFAAECVRGLVLERGFVEARGDSPLLAQEVAPLSEALGPEDQVVKFLALSPSLSAEEFHARVAEKVGDLAHVTHSDARFSLLEISAPGITKAHTLEAYATARGIRAEEVVAFGDMPNDVQMLSWAGEGYAMSGGHPEALAAARFQAPACEDDGVAQVLENKLRLLNGGSAGHMPEGASTGS